MLSIAACDDEAAAVRMIAPKLKRDLMDKRSRFSAAIL